jgi:MoaA/NifB/PqqE/SkfB family radical SAM enzyme
VHPSGFLPLSAGNVKHRPLTEIYRDSALFTPYQADLKGLLAESTRH